MKEQAGKLVFIMVIASGIFLFLGDKESFQSLAQQVLASPSPQKKSGDEFFVKVNPGNKTAAISAEQKAFFDTVKKEIKFCVEEMVPRTERRCPYNRLGKGGKRLPDKNCQKIKQAEAEIDCEKKMLGRIPYRQRPTWYEFRAEKMARDQKDLERLKGVKSSKKSGTTQKDEEWMKEF